MGVALVAPVAAAHLVVYLPTDQCGSPSVVVPGSLLPEGAKHAWIGSSACPQDHDAIPEPLLP